MQSASCQSFVIRLQFLAAVAISSVFISCASVDLSNTNKETELIGVQLNIATNQLDLGHADKALQTLKPLVAHFPDNFNVLTLTGMVHLALSNPDQALSFLRRAYNSEPTSASGLNLSSALIATGQQDRARNVLHKLLKKDENYQFKERLLHNIGVSYQKERNFPAAIKYFRLSLENNPGYYMSLIALAKVNKEIGNQSGTKEHLVRAVKACPSCYEPVHLLATAYINDSEIKSALSLLTSFSNNDDISPEDKESSLQLQRYLESKDPAAALAVRRENQPKKLEAFRSNALAPIATGIETKSSN